MLMRLLYTLLLSILFIAGCHATRPGEQQGEVSGKVTYKGKPLPGGRISFFGARGYNGMAIISPQGEYSIKAPLGECQIGVDNSILKSDPKQEKYKGKIIKKKPWDKADGDKTGEEMKTSHGVTGIYVPLPAHYADPTTSGLKYTVRSGSQTYDIELSDKP